MIIISAMSENRVIGIGDGMPWNVPGEYQQYLDFVSGETVVMGRRTFAVFGKDLPSGTTSIVISRGPEIDSVPTLPSVPEALRRAAHTGKQVFIAGGGSIYEQTLPLVDEMFLSTIKGRFDGDTYFPQFDSGDWTITEERDEAEYVFRKYLRRESVET